MRGGYSTRLPEQGLEEALPPNIDRKLVSARWATAAIFLLNGAFVGGIIPYYPQVQRVLGLSDGDLGLSLLFSPLGAVIATPFLGRLIGRFGSKNLIIATTFFVGVSTPLALVVPNVWLFRLALLLFGITNSSQDVSMNAHAVLVQHRFSKPIVSLMHCGWSLGGFLAGSGVALASRLGQSPFVHTVLANLLLMALILFASRWLLPHEPDDVVSEDAFVVPHGFLLVLGLLTMCAFFAEGAAFDWIAVFFQTVLGSSESMAATAFACFGFAMAGSRAFGDFVVHRIGNRRALLYGGLVAAAGILFAVSMRSPALSLGGFVLSAVGLANLIPILFRAGGSIDGVAPGTGVAAVSTCGYGAFLVSAPLIGLIADRSSLSVALGVVGLAGIAVAGFGPGALKRTRLE